MSQQRAFAAIPVFALALAATTAWATPATKVFESVSPSVVVVFAMDKAGKETSQGSGVVIASGVIVTNCHVLEDGVTYAVEHKKRRHPARLRHADWDRDVCSLSATGVTAPAVPLGSTRNLKVGHKVYAVGAPKGLELTLSEGILSSLRELDGGRYLQISAPISPGSSGGGLFDEEGRLIGLPTFYLSDGQQLNFAVPVEWIQTLPQRGSKAKPSGSISVNWLAKAIALEKKEDWPGLLKHAHEWIRVQPGEAEAWLALGNAYDKPNQSKQAIEAYQQALRINPKYAKAWYNLGNVYEDTGQRRQAIDAYQQALSIHPEYAEAWYNLGLAFGKASQSKQAVEAFQQALRIDPEYAKAWNSIGVAYEHSGELTKAIEAYQQGLRINPEYAKAWSNLGDVYTQSDQSTKAIEAYKQALRIDPGDASAWYNLGIAYRLSGQHGKVTEVYQRLKTLDPERANRFFNRILMP